MLHHLIMSLTLHLISILSRMNSAGKDSESEYLLLLFLLGLLPKLTIDNLNIQAYLELLKKYSHYPMNTLLLEMPRLTLLSPRHMYFNNLERTALKNYHLYLNLIKSKIYLLKLYLTLKMSMFIYLEACLFKIGTFLLMNLKEPLANFIQKKIQFNLFKNRIK